MSSKFIFQTGNKSLGFSSVIRFKNFHLAGYSSQIKDTDPSITNNYAHNI
jgi:hypothetical protein